jgi:energy-coupling factor transporter ATP-binding protein EcfA2
MIIGLTGKKGSGKTTAARMLLGKIRGLEHVNFKDALIAEMKERLPKTIAELEKQFDKDADWLFSNKPDIMRALLQDYGTTVRRRDSDTYWTDKWLEATAAMEHVVVDDVRFINEAQTVHNQGGVVIRLMRSDIVSTDNHESEVQMDSIKPDYTITVKEGGQDELSAELDRIIKGLVV